MISSAALNEVRAGLRLICGKLRTDTRVVRRRSDRRVSPALAAPDFAFLLNAVQRLRLRRQAVPDDADDSELPWRQFNDTPLDPNGRTMT